LVIAGPYPHLRQYVFSRTQTGADPEVEIVSGDAVEFVRGLKQQDGMSIWLCGGGKLAAQLRDEIDELIVKRHPIVIGSGIPLFDGSFDATRFVLATSRTFDTGVQFLTYVQS
jgi:dihydrofolate reductase